MLFSVNKKPKLNTNKIKDKLVNSYLFQSINTTTNYGFTDYHSLLGGTVR